MRRLIATMIALCLLAVALTLLAQRLGSAQGTRRDFARQLAEQSTLVAGQWAWRTVVPERDTLRYAMLVLQRGNTDGFFERLIQTNTDQIEWQTAGVLSWTGTIHRDNDVPPAHVYAIVLRPPERSFTLAEAVLQFGTPYTVSTRVWQGRTVCFARGVCVTTQLFSTSAPMRLTQRDPVIAVSYLPPRLVGQSARTVRWRGFGHH
jgi:hypothetical protein